MTKTEITKSSEVGRPRDVFSAMRDEMDRRTRDWKHLAAAATR